ncbi:hypothetical protein PRIPAC_82319 [Pristionchus pacificus]|uniref:Uncharacterized protein n=1 Tax=Pristionchus pacificus TaxID=54126 RepID=A0A2A6CAP4_PRIPA|nr:hypothetical protein PRIPAC_82319 [Pristionchus pacificus]|eukprot:PDM75199.1 hypothetical protein PRIPAC_43393 [Pristionchus pacificus]
MVYLRISDIDIIILHNDIKLRDTTFINAPSLTIQREAQRGPGSVSIDGEGDLRIHNFTILPSDQCATEDQRAAKCCCGTGMFYDYPHKRCEFDRDDT